MCCACSWWFMCFLLEPTVYGEISVIFLEPAELVVLTGYKRSADQIRWLERNGIPFTVNRLNRPVVRKDMDKSAVGEPELGPVP